MKKKGIALSINFLVVIILAIVIGALGAVSAFVFLKYRQLGKENEDLRQKQSNIKDPKKKKTIKDSKPAKVSKPNKASKPSKAK